jgi:hypothetical protein
MDQAARSGSFVNGLSLAISRGVLASRLDWRCAAFRGMSDLLGTPPRLGLYDGAQLSIANEAGSAG